MRIILLGPGTGEVGGGVWGGGANPWTPNSAWGSRDGQRKDGGGSLESWQPTGKGLADVTRPAKTARMAEEGVGTRDMAERFLKKRIEDGRVVDRFSLAIQGAKANENKC